MYYTPSVEVCNSQLSTTIVVTLPLLSRQSYTQTCGGFVVGVCYDVVVNFDHIKLRIEKPTTKANSERASLIEPFVTRLNNSRIAGGYKPLGAKFYATKMALIPTDELHAFYKELDSSKNFCALWWWKLKPKKD